MTWRGQSGGSTLLMRYSHLLSGHPYAVLLSVAFLFVALISLPFITHKFPDFSDPQLGFEPRQTDISTRLTAWENLLEATRTSGPLTLNPSELYHHQESSFKLHFADGRKKSRPKTKVLLKKNKGQRRLSNKTVGNFLLSNGRKAAPSTDNEDYVEEEDEDRDFVTSGSLQANSSHHRTAEDFFCGEPSIDYARVVLSSTTGGNLFTYDSLLAMCQLEHEILVGSHAESGVWEAYRSLCQPSKFGDCCRPWSIPNYIALLTNHTSCLEISEKDVIYAASVLNQCGNVYYDHHSPTECGEGEKLVDCHTIRKECLDNNWAFNVIHYLADKEFSQSRNKETPEKVPFLKSAVVFLPVACSTASMAYYSAIKDFASVSYNGIRVEAMELGLRDSLFDYHLIQDSWMLIGVAFAIGSCVWMYSGSLLIAVASIISIPLSLGLSYTAYKYIFRLSFFPFLNLVAAVISLGIGVDDAFIFCKMWKFLKQRAAVGRTQRNGTRKSSNIELQNELLFVGSNINQSEQAKHEEMDIVKSSHDNEATPDQTCRLETFTPQNPNQTPLAECTIDTAFVPESIPNTSSEDGSEIKSSVNTYLPEDIVEGHSKCVSVEWLVCETLKRAFQSMFITSLTTAVAFYLSYLSKVTAIRCFSIFAGTAVITNFLLMLTWFPAAVVIAERMTSHSCVTRPVKHSSLERCHEFLSSMKIPATSSLFIFSHVFSEKISYLIKICDTRFNITKPWAWTCVLTLGVVALFSVVIATYYPGLHPPNDLQFQLLHSSHLFERYHLVLRPNFNFEQSVNGRNEGYGREPGLPLRFVFGVLPLDDGDPLDPTSRVPRGHQASNLHFDGNFDVSSHQAQIWFLKFCQSIRSQHFYGSNSGPLLSNCFIETFKKWMSRRCIEPIELIDRTPCCETSKFPFARKVFRKCLLRALAQLHKTPHLLYLHRGESAGLRFLKTKPHQIVAAVIEYESGIPFTTSFSTMHQFYNTVESWMKEQMRYAPQGVKCGWFISNLHFYDLQLTLSTGVLSGVCISLGVSAITLLVFTCNILKSLLTSLSIASATSVALASLSLLGWSLGPVESLTLSLAVGLSADFALHYAICHQSSSTRSNGCCLRCKRPKCMTHLCECYKEKIACERCNNDDDDGVNNSDTSCDVDPRVHSNKDMNLEPFVGIPATLAAITTVIAGLLMLPSSVVAYNQVGIFLIVLISTSWFYSTFFLLSLLRLFQAY